MLCQSKLNPSRGAKVSVHRDPSNHTQDFIHVRKVNQRERETHRDYMHKYIKKVIAE